MLDIYFNFMDSSLKYYGLDWIAMIMTFLSIYLLGKKNKYGFIFGLLANASWFGFGILAQSVGNMFANVILTILNVKGYRNWKNAKN